ncbi:MAG: response regulator [Kofleriaceae bacterium]
MLDDPRILALVRAFVSEADEIIQRVTRALLGLERGGPDAQRLRDTAARGLHSLKGGAGTLGLGALAELIHNMETALAQATPPLSRDEVDALLRGLDAFLAGIRAAGSGQLDAGTQHLAEASRRIEALVTAGRGTAAAPLATAMTTEPLAAEEASSSWRIDSTIVVALAREVERVRDLRLRIDQRRRHIDRELALLQQIRGTGDISVRLAAISKGLAGDGEDTGDAVAALDEGLKAVSTLPVRSAIEPLFRAVRDLCRQLDKQATLSVVGADVSVDRRILAGLRAPLIQLVRNAVAHGIEAPQVRANRSKHEDGSIVIRVEHSGNVMTLEIEDDGGGLDLARIREVVRDRGLRPADVVATLEDAELQRFIFMPGFTTRTDVSDAAGRGVGLDVVRNQVLALDGTIEVHSSPSQGTRFVITLPIDVGSSPLLLLRVGDQEYGIPMLSVERGLLTTASTVRSSGAGTHAVYRDQLIPIVDLAAALRMRSPRQPGMGKPLVVIHSRGERIALLVDDIIGDQDVVIRPMPPELRGISAYLGVSAMALGDALLVLSPRWLVASARKRTDAPAATELGRRALVVDDSLTARAIYRTILETGGYQVHVAASARHAIELLEHQNYDVMLVDVMLGEDDGIALVATVKAKPETADLPTILISANDTDYERHRGLTAGADAFMGKRECASPRLLGEVAALVARRTGALA